MTALSCVYILAACLCLIRIFSCAVIAVEAEEKGNDLAATAIKKKADFWVAGVWVTGLFALGAM